MPTYVYKCQKCGETFESVQKITDAPLQECQDPACKGPVERVITPGGGFLFKGSGFYITDYRSDSYKKKAQAETPASSKETTKPTEKKSETGSSTEKKGAPSSNKASSDAK